MRHNVPVYIGKRGLLFALIAAAFTPYAFAVPAGRVDFAFGSVSATGVDGKSRPLDKGADINSGDSIATGDGRVQIRFTDGAYLSLQPNTVFKVDNYAFNGKNDGNEKGFFSLVKGGLRTVSGLIGKANKQSYEVRTPTATIGIRGTAYSADQSDRGLIVSVGQGLVSVTNQGGSLTLGTGQSAIVRSQLSGPAMTNEKAGAQQSIQPEQAQQEEAPVIISEQRAADGKSVAVAGSTPEPTLAPKPTPTPAPISAPIPAPAPAPMPTMLTTGVGYTVAYAATGPSGAPAGVNYHAGSNTATFDGGGTLKDFNGGGSNINFAGAAQETGTDSLIGWGRWTGPVTGNLPGSGITYAGAEGFHYITGIPTSTANLNLGSNAVATYSMVGATLPSTYNGSTTTGGTLGGAKALTVTFSAIPTMAMNFDVITTGATYVMSGFGTFNLSMVAGSQAVFTANPSSSTVCTSTCAATLSGIFSGAAGERVGIAYSIQDAVNGKTIKGAAAFKLP